MCRYQVSNRPPMVAADIEKTTREIEQFALEINGISVNENEIPKWVTSGHIIDW